MLPTELEVLPEGRRVRVAHLPALQSDSHVPLVLLHGYPDNLQIWCRLAPLLQQAGPVRAFDWPGLGYSDPWKGGTTPDHMADRLLALLDHWGWERVVPVGLDMGGQPALSFAARYPERTAGVVVMNSLVMPDERTSWEIVLLRKFGWNRLILRHLPRLVFLRAQHTFLPFGMRIPAELRSDLWQAFRRPEVRKFLVRMCAGYQGRLPQLEQRYPEIRVPTLLLWGANDPHFPPSQAEALHRLIPGSRLQILPGGHHWMPWHAPELVAAEVLSFLDGIR